MWMRVFPAHYKYSMKFLSQDTCRLLIWHFHSMVKTREVNWFDTKERGEILTFIPPSTNSSLEWSKSLDSAFSRLHFAISFDEPGAALFARFWETKDGERSSRCTWKTTMPLRDKAKNGYKSFMFKPTRLSISHTPRWQQKGQKFFSIKVFPRSISPHTRCHFLSALCVKAFREAKSVSMIWRKDYGVVVKRR